MNKKMQISILFTFIIILSVLLIAIKKEKENYCTFDGTPRFFTKYEKLQHSPLSQ